MKCIKPMRLGLLTRVFRWQQQDQLGIAALALVSLDGSPRLHGERDLWKLLADEAPQVAPIDACIPKSRAEYLVTGSAFAHAPGADRPAGERHPHAPGSALHEGCTRIEVVMGERSKVLHVWGDRTCSKGVISEAAPFESVAIEWAHAFGGPRIADNPEGMGSDPTDEAGTLYRVPNIEYPDSPWRVPGTGAQGEQRIAGLTPVDAGRPVRASLCGSFDPPYLERDFPGYPDGTDWRYFNVAPPDQQFDKDQIESGTRYLLRNLHPDTPEISGHVPAFTVRAFCTRSTAPGQATGDDATNTEGTRTDEFVEIAMRRTTVWFFPHRNRMLLIFHGSVPVREFDAADIGTLMFGVEHEDSPVPVEHYVEVAALRSDHREGPIQAVTDDSLLPVDLQAPDDMTAALERAQRMQSKLTGHVNARLARTQPSPSQTVEIAPAPLDLPGNGMTDKTPPSSAVADLSGLVRQADEKAQALRDSLSQSSRPTPALQVGSDGAAQATTLRPDATTAPVAAAASSAVASGSEPFTGVHPATHSLLDTLRERASAGSVTEHIGEETRQLRDLYRASAQHASAARPPVPVSSDRARALIDRLRARADTGIVIDLTGADLSGMDLRGLDLSDALLEQANLTDAQLAGARLSHAVLVRAKLERTDLSDAVLDGATFASAHIVESNFSNAQLARTHFGAAVMRNVAFRRATLINTDFSQSRLEQVSFDEASLRCMHFVELDLHRVSFRCSRIEKLVFMDSTINGFDASGARAMGLSFVNSRFTTPPDFSHAILHKCFFAPDIDLSHANLEDARIRESALRGIDMRHAQLSRAIVETSDLSEADLRGASLDGLITQHALFVRTNFGEASLKGSYLVRALMQGADLRGARLDGANLCQADLANVRLSSESVWPGAYTRKVKIYPGSIDGRTFE